MRALLASAALLASTAFAAPAFAQALVILESSMPNYAAGGTLDAGQALNLPDKARLVLVSESGKTIALTGPFTGKAGDKLDAKGGGGKLTTALASLVRSTQEDTGSVGAIRAAGILTREDALMINASESGDYCILDPKSVQITRYKQETAPSIVLNAVKGDTREEIKWPSGQNNTPWPASAVLDDGAVYLIEQPGKDTRTMITLHRMDGKAESDIHQAILMAEEGCMEQAKMLLALVKKQAR